MLDDCGLKGSTRVRRGELRLAASKPYVMTTMVPATVSSAPRTSRGVMFSVSRNKSQPSSKTMSGWAETMAVTRTAIVWINAKL